MYIIIDLLSLHYKHISTCYTFVAAATSLLVLAVDDGDGFLSYEKLKVTMNLKMPHYQNLVHWMCHTHTHIYLDQCNNHFNVLFLKNLF